MKRYFAVVSMMCLFALAGIAGAVAQEAQKANPATDFKYDLTEDGEGVIIKKYTGTSTDVVIPAVIEDFPVVTIGFEAFKGTNIVSVVLPDSITRISYSCFEGCQSLQNVVLPKDLTYIAASLFEDCTALKSITLPDSIEIIYKSAFQSSGLESIEIPDSVTVIANGDLYTGAFAYCKNLKTVNIGKGIKHIGKNAFRYCSSLTIVTIGVEKLAYGKKITIRGEDYFPGYGKDVFLGCSALSLKDRKKIRDTGYTGEF